MNDLTIFPIELQELILEKLMGLDLLNMSKVCKLWYNICERISKKKYAKIIPKECIKEIEITVNAKNVWLTAMNYHFIQQSIINNVFNNIDTVSVELSRNYHQCFCIFGPLVFIGCISGNIEIYNLEKSENPVEIIKLLDQPIFHMKIMPIKSILIVKTNEKSLEILSLPYISGKSWVYKINYLKVIFLDTVNDIVCEKNFSTYNSLLAIVTSSHQINVYQVDEVNRKKVHLKLIANYVTEKTIGTISIWDDEIIALCRSGEILRWCFFTQICFISHKYQEICYENPVWIFRNRIFCSTIISSQLLEYWHMNRGSGYWLIGKPYSDLISCRDLGNLGDADNNNKGMENVLCVSLNQRLLACGTRTGKILLYYLSDKCFSSEDLNDKENNHLKNEFNRAPDLIIKTKERPITNIQIQLDENSVKIYIWPYVTHNEIELKRFFECIILK